MRFISALVLILGWVALTVSASSTATPSPPAAGPLLADDTPPLDFGRRSSAPPRHYIKMYRRTTGYIKPLPSAPPLPMTQPPPKGSLHRAYKMPKLPPAFQAMVAQKYGKKRKYGRMMNGN